MNVNIVIRKLRKQKKITLERLAALTGLTKGYLSKIERAPKAPPFSTLELIARALDVDISYLLKQGTNAPLSKDIDIMHKSDWKPMDSMDMDSGSSRRGNTFTPLLHSHHGKYMTPVLITIAAGDETQFKHDAEEFVYVLKGKVSLTYGDDTWELRENDSFYLDSRQKHVFKNNSRSPVQLLSVYYSYRRY